MATKQPNILIIWGDDIGWFNVSAYNHGIMGYRTPHIDRIAKEGCMFTDWYGQQSCTAGRAAFITGQSPIRSPRRRGRAELRPPHAQRANPAQGDEGWLVSLRAELLPALPASGAHGTGRRHLDLPPRVSLHRSRGARVRALGLLRRG